MSGFEAVWNRVSGSYEGSAYGVIGAGVVRAQRGEGRCVHGGIVALVFVEVKERLSESGFSGLGDCGTRPWRAGCLTGNTA